MIFNGRFIQGIPANGALIQNKTKQKVKVKVKGGGGGKEGRVRRLSISSVVPSFIHSLLLVEHNDIFILE